MISRRLECMLRIEEWWESEIRMAMESMFAIYAEMDDAHCFTIGCETAVDREFIVMLKLNTEKTQGSVDNLDSVSQMLLFY